MSELPLPPATRSLGASGIQVSPMAWGMWRLTENGRTVESGELLYAELKGQVFYRFTPAELDWLSGQGLFKPAFLDYLGRLRAHGFSHGVLVQPSFLGTDNRYLLSALQTVPGQLRGVVMLERNVERARHDCDVAQG